MYFLHHKYNLLSNSLNNETLRNTILSIFLYESPPSSLRCWNIILFRGGSDPSGLSLSGRVHSSAADSVCRDWSSVQQDAAVENSRKLEEPPRLCCWWTDPLMDLHHRYGYLMIPEPELIITFHCCSSEASSAKNWWHVNLHTDQLILAWLFDNDCRKTDQRNHYCPWGKVLFVFLHFFCFCSRFLWNKTFELKLVNFSLSSVKKNSSPGWAEGLWRVSSGCSASSRAAGGAVGTTDYNHFLFRGGQMTWFSGWAQFNWRLSHKVWFCCCWIELFDAR